MACKDELIYRELPSTAVDVDSIGYDFASVNTCRLSLLPSARFKDVALLHC
jgi:hypothetical protein